MSKTDKELTAEIVNNAFANWNFSSALPGQVKHDVLTSLIRDVYDTLKNLKD